MARRHSPDELVMNRHTPTSGWHRGIRTLLILLVLAVALLSGQPNAESMPGSCGRPLTFRPVLRVWCATSSLIGGWWGRSPELDPQTGPFEKRGKAQIGVWVIVWGRQSEAGSLRGGSH